MMHKWQWRYEAGVKSEFCQVDLMFCNVDPKMLTQLAKRGVTLLQNLKKRCNVRCDAFCNIRYKSVSPLPVLSCHLECPYQGHKPLLMFSVLSKSRHPIGTRLMLGLVSMSQEKSAHSVAIKPVQCIHWPVSEMA